MVGVNITLPLMLLESLRGSDCRLFINTGSFFEYRQSAEPLTETAPLQPINQYAATKVAFQQLLDWYVEQLGICAVTLRLFSVFGSADNANKIVPSAIRRFRARQPLDMTQGDQQLDFIFVGDVVEAYLATLERRATLAGHLKINIGSGCVTTVRKLVSRVAHVMGVTPELKLGSVPTSPRDIMHAQAAVEKARCVLGWSPKYTLDLALRKTLDEELVVRP